jgi:hypothetical protein
MYFKKDTIPFDIRQKLDLDHKTKCVYGNKNNSKVERSQQLLMFINYKSVK